MASDSLYWALLATFGLTTIVSTVATLDGPPGAGAVLSLAGGLVIVGTAAVAIARDEALGDDDSRLARLAIAVGALLYTVVTAMELFA